MSGDNPAGFLGYYVPFILLVIMFFVLVFYGDGAKKKKASETGEFFLGLILIGILGWTLVNIARFIIYIVPFSGPVISSPYASFPAIAIGVVLYRVRGKYPLFYGITEILVAVLAIFVSIGTPTPNPLNKLVGVLGGLYILIRGLDNMDRGLPASWRGRWDKWFPKRQSNSPVQVAIEKATTAPPARVPPSP